MPQLYKLPKDSLGLSWCVGLGVICAGLVFLLVPMTQLLRTPTKTVVEIESIDLAPPPPPRPLEEQVKPEPDEPDPPLPELDMPPPKPSLEQLELSLNPGLGGDLSFDAQIHLTVSTESADELSKLFGFNELDEVPRLVQQGRPKMQQSAEFQRLMRKAGEKQVVLEVALSPQGVVTVQRVQSATHEALIPAATQAAESSRFSPPMRNGQAVRARYTWPLSF
jgi:periplasmic protein TonB